MELVVLVDEQNNEIGTAEKNTVHSTNTPLHRGFSLFLFNYQKQLLLTQRSFSKKTFPGIWTNTVCGHPSPGEKEVDAAIRRLKDELGIDLGLIGLNPHERSTLVKVIAQYRYRFADKNGIVENEVCPILVAHCDLDPQPNPNEIENWKWIDWKEFLVEIKKRPEYYSPWCVEEAKILEKILRY